MIGALVQQIGQQSEQPVPVMATKPAAEPIWQADSVVTEPTLQVEPTVKVTPAPPLPQEKFEFRSLPPRDESETPSFAPLPKLQEAEPDDQGAIQIRNLPTLPPTNQAVSREKSWEVERDDQGGIQIRNLPALPPTGRTVSSQKSQENEPVIDLGQLINTPAVDSAASFDFAAPAVEESPAKVSTDFSRTPDFSRTLNGAVVDRLPKPAEISYSKTELAQNKFEPNKLPSQSSDLQQALASADVEVSQFGFAEPLVQEGDFKIKLVSAELPADPPAKKKKKKVVVAAKKGGASKSALAKSKQIR